MVGLYLVICSFADMTLDRALAIARVFDAHPGFRPVKVGGDPARIKVEPSMEALVLKQGVPISWLTVRRGGQNFEGGDISLCCGRGAFVGIPDGDGGFRYSLIGHRVEQYWLADILSEPAAVEEVTALFEELVIASDAAYGCVATDTGGYPPKPYLKFSLPGVYWLNYFGPAFLSAHPELGAVSGARMLPTGGSLVRTTDQAAQAVGYGIPAWQEPLRAILGEQAFRGQDGDSNPYLPSIEEHVAASPGTMEMPWVARQAKRTGEDQAKKHASARKRLARALEGRAEPVLGADAVEWSTSFDLPDWQDFAKYLTRKLRGDFSTAIGKAVLAVIATAPIDQEDSILLDTQLGTIRLHWFIDDTDVVDAYIYGSSQVQDICVKWLEVEDDD